MIALLKKIIMIVPAAYFLVNSQPINEPTDMHSPQTSSVVFDTLSGPLPQLLKAKKTPYLVVGDIEVPANKTVSIEAGTVLLFKSFTGIHVVGKLIALGTKEKPIYFTSENDQSVNSSTALYPNPYDWNGMYIHSDGIGTSLAYCKLLYSVYGIVSETKFIRLDPVQLKQNGKSNLIIEGKETVTTDKPYTYVLSTKDATVDGVPVTLLRDPLRPKRLTVRIIGLSVGLAGIAGSVYYGLDWKDKRDKLIDISTDNREVLHNYNEQDWLKLKDKRDRALLYTCAGAMVTVMGTIGFSYSFSF
jgi:hypothetical protein